MPVITRRRALPDVAAGLIAGGENPFLAGLYAARGVATAGETRADLARLAAPREMRNLEVMARHLADAVASRQRLLIVADYDTDGATACAVGLRALRAFGARVDYLVPDRFRYGYGLTPEIVRLAAATKQPDILITVDNGIASVDGVATANGLGLKVFITDHHLPGPELPQACCIVNPNQPGCEFPSKHLAGVGVMFYLMLALRAELRERGAFRERMKAEGGRRKESHENADPAFPSSLIPHPSSLPSEEPNLADLLDLVALGTVADVVKLDANNRILVRQGLNRMRAGRTQPGMAALFRVARREPPAATVHDLGFALAPRLNAAGRLADMALGIECLATEDPRRAADIALELDRLNRERRSIEAGMQETAAAAVERVALGESYSLTLFDPGWHQGVVGLVASRIKERYRRPTIALARCGDGLLRGSGRSIAALHLRDALDRVATRHPGLILKFGGHAAAAGLTLREADFERFAAAFEATARDALTAADLEEEIDTDGSLAIADATAANASLLREQVWGAGFPEPRFVDRFQVLGQRIVGERHLKLRLVRGQREFEAMLFGTTGRLPPHIDAVYRLDVNDYDGSRRAQLTVQHWFGAESA
jgi:single-stranded-DNA-specific exonuclease